MSKGGMSVGWQKLPPVVPVPAVYIDRIMPFLTDAEWRVLCIIIRQTLGWVDPTKPGMRKERDWITQSQFRDRTGKSRDSISRAIAGLVQHDLIVVESREGELLQSAQSRQRARDRVFYRLKSISQG